MSIFSSPDELEKIATVLSHFFRLPFSGDTIPGDMMESVLAHVRNGEVLKTYDFVDVINKEEKIGWQVKSTKASTPVTWKRAKLPNSSVLIKASQNSEEGLQFLGNAIIDLCNIHAYESLFRYQLNEIGLARLIIHTNKQVTYYERILCSQEQPIMFSRDDFYWEWSTQKKTKKKQQLPALRGIHKETGKKWWSWHGLGENQLHFVGENEWWPTDQHSNSLSFKFPEEKMPIEEFMELLGGNSYQPSPLASKTANIIYELPNNLFKWETIND